MRRIPMIPCLLGVAVAFVLLLALGVQAGTMLAVGAVLVCPLMMVLMMGGMARGMGHGRGAHGPAGHEEAERPDHTSGAPSS